MARGAREVPDPHAGARDGGAARSDPAARPPHRARLRGRAGIRRVEVRADARVSLNGRPAGGLRRSRRRSGARAATASAASAGSCPRPTRRRRSLRPHPVADACDVSGTNLRWRRFCRWRSCWRRRSLRERAAARVDGGGAGAPTARGRRRRRARARRRVRAGDGGAPTPRRRQRPPPTRAAAPTAAACRQPPARDEPRRLEELTVVGTREARTAGSAHVLRPRDLERMDYDNPETVVKAVPGVYARGEDGFGLRPNIGIRGASPDRSKKITLMEDGILFGPAPYSAPAAYYFPLITRMELVRVIKGPGAISFGPQTVGGAIDLVTRAIPADEDGRHRSSRSGSTATARCTATSAPAPRARATCIEGVHLALDRLQGARRRRRHRLREERVDVEGALPAVDRSARAAGRSRLKLGYSDEDSRETYLGLTDADFRATRSAATRASALDRMQWHRTQIGGDATTPSFARGVHPRRRRLPPRLLAHLAQGQPHRAGAAHRLQCSANPTGRATPILYQRADRRERHSTGPARWGIRPSTSAPTSATFVSAGRAGRRRLARAARARSRTGSRPASASTTTASTGSTPRTAS